MEQILSNSVASRRLTVQVIGLLALLALVLAVVGIHGTTAYVVTQRTREMGIRMALGARKEELMWSAVGRALLVVIIGEVGGLILAVALKRLIASQLYGVEALDPISFLAAPVLLAAAALLGSYIPSRRILRVDPVIALRN
jgi:ABC-type antimicrobial peptide transport system permease subunit